MDCNAKSCATCTRTCWLVHGRKSSSPVIASFFKIMIGDDFSNVLFLPPKFVSEMSGLFGKSAILEDSNGQQWEVTVSNVNGSLAFNLGWSDFASSHDLELGDFVVFFQLTESLFVVKIYDRTACERMCFSKRSCQRKRRRVDISSTGKDGPSASTNMPCFDPEPCCMNTRNLGEQQGEDRICNLDLSLFETWSCTGREGSSKAATTSKIFPHQVPELLASGAPHLEKDSCITPTSSQLVPISVAAKGNNQVSPYQELGSNNDNRQSVQKKFGGVSEAIVVPTSSGIENCQSGKRLKVIKEESVEINSVASNTPAAIGTKDCQSGKRMKVIKQEAVEINMDPVSPKTTEDVSEGLPKLIKGKCFQKISKGANQNCRSAAKTDIVGQVVTADRVAHAVKTNRVAQVMKNGRVVQVAKDDRVALVAKLDRSAQVAKPDNAAQVEKTDKGSQEVKTKSVAQVVKTESVDLAGTENCQSAKVTKIVKEESIENKTATCSQETMGKRCGEPLGVTKDSLRRSRVPQRVVKTEATDLDGGSPAFSSRSGLPQVAVRTEIIDLDESAATFSPLVATCSESFVELPDYLPFPTVKGRANTERKTVIIRDPAKRLWPVLYHGRPSLKVLASGWADLSKANRIKSGDQCRFALEDASDGIYAVSVVPT